MKTIIQNTEVFFWDTIHDDDVAIHMDPEGYPHWLPDYAGNKSRKTIENPGDNQRVWLCDRLDFILHFTIIVTLEYFFQEQLIRKLQFNNLN